MGFLVFLTPINEMAPVRTTLVTYVNSAVALVLESYCLASPSPWASASHWSSQARC
jgi:hypothetical protein